MSRTILVTGATGFIAGHVIEQLLAAGDHVIGTVRDPAKAESTAHLRAMPGAADRLSLVAADLMADDPFSAHTDVDAILHMASPYVMNAAEPQRDLVDPAVKGTLSLFEAAAKSPRVKRVVLTSSMAAITDEPDGRVLTEKDWNTQSTLTRNPYHLSKMLAEKAAWDWMKGHKAGFDLVVINPFLVIGPSHTKTINTSNQTFVDLLKGTYPAVMDLTWGFVDVRDVATAHVRALDPAVPSARYICAGETLSMTDVLAEMRKAPVNSSKLPRMKMTGAVGTAMLKLASQTQPKGVGSYLRTHLGRVPRYDTTVIRTAMHMTFRPSRDSLRDTLNDLVRWGHVKKAA